MRLKTEDIDPLNCVLASLKLSSIMTPRELWSTAKLEDQISTLQNGPLVQYSYIPVVLPDGGVCGWLDRASVTADGSGKVKDLYTRLEERMLKTTSVSIFDFIQSTLTTPCSFVAEDSRIVGLVCLADLQKLPVRVALFSMISNLEYFMGERLAMKYESLKCCFEQGLLKEDRYLMAQKQIDASKKNDSYVNDFLLTQFCDKTRILRVAGDISMSGRKLSRIENFRNLIAHSHGIDFGPLYLQKNIQILDDMQNLILELKSFPETELLGLAA